MRGARLGTASDIRGEILGRVQERGFCRVAELAAELGCSEMTVRRHLDRLEGEGLVERTHGGASPTRRVRLEFSLYERAQAGRREKAAIGAAAAKMVKDGERIILDTGTTTLAMAGELRGQENITVITTSLAIISELLHEPGIECMMLGGVVRESSPDLYGPMMEEALSRIHVDRAFIGCDGMSDDGALMTTDPRVARATALMIQNSDWSALLVDSSKLGRKSFIAFANVTQVDCLITDNKMNGDLLARARTAGAETVVIDPDNPQE
jgi:DeoR/GlpR family transcriptional regulator of sugar metabolism